MRRIAFYVLCNQSSGVADYVFYTLRQLGEHVEKMVVVCDGRLTYADRMRLEDLVDLVHVRDNWTSVGSAHREGLAEVVGTQALAAYDEVVLLDDGIYGPLFPFIEIFSAMEKNSDIDFWQVTATHGSRQPSHFLVIRQQLLTHGAFRAYLDAPPDDAAPNPYKVRKRQDEALPANEDEGFATHFLDLGFRCAYYCEPDETSEPAAIPNSVDWLVSRRCPIMARSDFMRDPLTFATHGLDLARTLSVIKACTSYDTNLILKDLAKSAKPRNLYTNASLFEVMSDSGPKQQLRPGIKLAVLAHMYYPEMLPEVLSYLRNIPVAFDLYLTTTSSAKRQLLQDGVATLKKPGFNLREVRVVENRGRDVSALVIGLRDVVMSGSYDYICRIHSKMSPQDSLGMARHFKAHLYENLLASPSYVARLLTLFENEDRLGIVMAPVVHIGYPTLGHAWFTNRPMAEIWAAKLGIEVPFDEFTPLAAYGSMYWFRPAALKRLCEHPFEWQDFPREPDYSDGGLAHVLERLVVYAAHQDGYYAKCALTPSNAAENYVKLEYKLQDVAHQRFVSVGSNELLAFPIRAVKNYFQHRLQSTPGLRVALKSLYRAGRTTYRAATLSR